MRVLITGGAGFIGSHVAEACVRAHYDVVVVDDLSIGKRAWVPKAAKFYKLDICSPKLPLLVKRVKPHYVCHLAASVSVPRAEADPSYDASVNIVGTLNVVRSLEGLSLQKFLFVSSAAVYGEPSTFPTTEDSELQPRSAYGLSKYTAERYLNYFSVQRGFPVVVVRPANVYGPRQSSSGEAGVIAKFAHSLVRGEQIVIDGQGQQTRDFIYVTDVAAGMVAAMERGVGTFNLSTSTEVSVRELVIRMGEIMGTVPRVTYGPTRASDIARSVLAHTRARRELHWQSQVPFIEGLRLTLK